MKASRLDRRIRTAAGNMIETFEQRQLFSATLMTAIAAQSLSTSQSPLSLSLAAYFADSSVASGDTVVNLVTDLPAPDNSIPLELTTAATPNTVANFLRYISSGEYANTIFHRSVPGFVIQGGGYKTDGTQINSFGAINGEYQTATAKNATPGTIAMALSTGPNSATSEWYINLADNSELDTGDGGPFTAFGQTLYNGLAVANAIAALPIVDDTANGAWNTLPVENLSNGATVSSVPTSDFVTINPVVLPGGLSYSVTSSNPAVAAATVSNGDLFLTAVGGGTSEITVTATDLGGGTAVSTFTASVPTVQIANATARAGTVSAVSFPVTLTAAATGPVTLHYALTPGSASASDYEATGSSLTIPTGQTTANISVDILHSVPATGATFTISLSDLSSNASFATGGTTETATGTILPPLLSTATALQVGSATIAAGGSETFTATVSPSGSNVTPTGTVNFSVNGSSVGSAALAGGVATFTAPLSTAGPQTATATYSGDDFYNPSTSTTAAVTVTTEVSIADASATIGSATQVLFPVTLSVASDAAETLSYTLAPLTAQTGDYAATGNSLTIPAGSTTANIPVSIVATAVAASETFSVTLATSSRDLIFAGGSSTATGTILPPFAGTTTTLKDTSSAVAAGDNDTFIATITPSVSGNTVAGTVTFSVNGTAVGVASVANGAASLTVPLSTPGNQSVTAAYSGSSTCAASTSAAIKVNVSTLTPVVTRSTLPVAAVSGTGVRGTIVVTATDSIATAEKGVATLNIYAATTGVIDSNSVLVATVKRSINLKAGSSVTVPIPVSIPASKLAAGSYTLLAQTVDPLGDTSDSAGGIPVTYSAPEISLAETITRIAPLPAKVVAGSRTTSVASVKITNSGNIASVGTTTVSLLDSTDGTAAAGTVFKTVTRRLSIPAGKSVVVPVPLGRFPTAPGGSYFIVAEVTDPKGGVSSKDFPTSVATVSAEIDLASTIAKVPATGKVKKTIPVTIYLVNNGTVSAAGALEIAFSLSSSNDGSNPITLATISTHIDVGSTQSQTLHVNVPIAAGIAPGNDYLVSDVDPDDTYDDTDLSNNTSVSTSFITIS